MIFVHNLLFGSVATQDNIKYLAFFRLNNLAQIKKNGTHVEKQKTSLDMDKETFKMSLMASGYAQKDHKVSYRGK